ncbi:replication protein A 32 kDa subunit B-like [Triticum aestivum]|uniref:replication protein A 32 kDa subunit B-like n=1 Tax=Triticum aestivum TaxID=4565 RepID=UPI001D034532|nr:replication protein A 32 kDa subunit B-like [Triticum aestivum]
MVNKQVSDNSVFFTLADGTGCVKARVWFENGIDVMCSASISDGVYVKITGRLRAELGVPVVAAYSLSVVTNFNDITHHFLDCIYVHLMMRSDHAKRVVHSLALVPFAASACWLALHAVSQRLIKIRSNRRRLGVKAEEENLTDMIMGFLDQPGISALEHGVSVNLVVERLGIPESEAR